MTNISKFFSDDDPRLTAFALGELEGEELAAVEAALRDDPAARAAVAEIRAMAGHLEAALGAEAAADARPAEAPLQRAAILPGRDPAKLDGGPMGKLLQFPKFKFPQLYYLVGGLAAAAFAILVVRQQPPAHPMRELEKKAYTEVSLQKVAEESGNKQEAEAAADASLGRLEKDAAQDKKRDVVAAGSVSMPAVRTQAVVDALASSAGAPKAPEPANEPKEMRQRSAPSVVAVGGSNTMVTGAAGGAVARDDEKLTMSKFSVSTGRDQGRQETGPSTGNRRGLEAQAGFQNAGQLKNNQLRAYIQTPSDNLRLVAQNSTQQFAAGKAKVQANTESYAYRNDNDFLGAGENPLSTFSIDVDTASYANVRRFLAEGRLPPPDAVRIEELVNYFPYRYAPPSFAKASEGKPATAKADEVGATPFAASMEVAEAPWAPGHRLVRIGLKSREVSTAQRAPANLVFLLDVSGSMDEPNKLPLVKESMRLLLGRLRADDRVAIVVYAGASGLALPSTPVAKSPEILAALDALTPGGSTNGAMGIQLAYDIAKANYVTGGLNRVILCTDGDFNVGVTSEGDLTRLIKEKAKSGVFLTVLGFGMGNYKDATLEKLADEGNGNYGYIDSRREAEKLLVEQVNGTLLTIAKDVKLQVEFNPAQVASYRLIGYENRLLKKEDFNNDTVDAGEIGAGHTVTALYEIVPISQAIEKGRPAFVPSGGTTAWQVGTSTVDELKYRKPEGYDHRAVMKDTNQYDWPSRELLTLKVRFKEPAGAVSRKLEFPLTDAGARFADASTDFKFAAAVAEFGMILRDSPHKGTGTLAEVRAWAQAGTDNDAGGYRGEFIELVRQAETLLR